MQRATQTLTPSQIKVPQKPNASTKTDSLLLCLGVKVKAHAESSKQSTNIESSEQTNIKTNGNDTSDCSNVSLESVYTLSCDTF